MKNLIITTLSIIFVLSGCAQTLEIVRGSGHVVTIERTTDDYEAIAVSGFYNIELVLGQEGQLTLVGEDNLLDWIETEVKDGILQIKPREYLNFVPPGARKFLSPFQSMRYSKSGFRVRETLWARRPWPRMTWMFSYQVPEISI